jgi:hypothetical protein
VAIEAADQFKHVCVIGYGVEYSLTGISWTDQQGAGLPAYQVLGVLRGFM